MMMMMMMMMLICDHEMKACSSEGIGRPIPMRQSRGQREVLVINTRYKEGTEEGKFIPSPYYYRWVHESIPCAGDMLLLLIGVFDKFQVGGQPITKEHRPKY